MAVATPGKDGSTAYRPLWQMVTRVRQLLQDHTVLVLALLFCTGVVIMQWQVSRIQSNLITAISLQNASLYTQALAELRTLYTSEVVETVRDHGIEVTHDYVTKDGAIPLPVTLSLILGKHIGAQGSGAQSRLYSAYPFPWHREEGGLRDTFGQSAWQALQQHPDTAFYRFEEVEGRQVLRYATADRMRPDCVSCHNTHPESPKVDWQTGDVRGILEVILPLDAAIAQTHVGLRGSFTLMASMSILGLSALAMVISRLRRSSADLEQRAQTLRHEINQRQQAEEALQQAHDTLEQQVQERTSDLEHVNRALQSEMTERHQAEEALYLTQFAIDHSADAAFWMELDARFIYVNESACRILGYSREALLSMTVHDIDPEFPPEGWDEQWRQLQSGSPVVFESRYRTQDGRLFPVEISNSYLHYNGHDYHCALVRDTSERKRAEAALHESEAQYRLLVEQSIQGISILSRDGRRLFANEAFAKMLGYASVEAYQRSPALSNVAPHERDRMHPYLDTIWHGERTALRYEYEAIRVDKKLIWLERLMTPVEWAGESATLSTIIDITERKHLDAQLRQSERLASLGTFAAGMAHELNNPLGAIQITTEYAQDALALEPEHRVVRDCLSEILDDAQRCAQIVKRVLHFARPANRVKSQVALHPLIRIVEAHTQQYVEQKGGQLALIFASEQPYVIAHEEEIELVLINLIRNAVEASGPGGTITVRTEVFDGEVQVSVQDLGMGLSEAEQQRVFDPFYTTRETSGGTGLGLSIVYRIVTDHDGLIALESRLGQGTTVRFQLPLAPLTQP